MSPPGENANPTVRKGKSEFQYIIEAMKEQWVSMVGMMAMFIITIGLGMLLQPFYNQSDDLRAFGKDGASQGRWIILELLMIFAFTALIIWLARKKKEWIIKVGILAILWLALVYATVPLAHLILAPEMGPDPFVEQEAVAENGTFVMHLGASGYMMYEVEAINSTLYNHTLKATTANGDWKWSTDIPLSVETLRVTTQDDGYVVSAGQDLWVLDSAGQEVLHDDCRRAASPAACSVSFNHTYNDNDYIYTMTDEPRLVRFDPFGKGNLTKPVKDAQWAISSDLNIKEGALMAQKFDDDRFMIIAPKYASFFHIPETTSPPVEGRDSPTDWVEEIWNASAPEGTNFSAVEWGISPWSENAIDNNSGEEMLLLLGTESGDVMSWNFDLKNNEVVEEERMKLADNDAVDGPIHAIRLGDYGAGGWNEIFVAGGDTLHMFLGSTLVDYIHIDIEGDTPEAIHILANDDGAVVTWLGNSSWEGGQLEDSMLFRSGLQLDSLSSWVGLLTATLLMAWLIWRPEWYVVNTTGVLVGSGVVVMLGIAFVPWLVIFFMVLAAIYDHWAVHKSKHMLDLADTMIGLKLPILLVAPQEKGYSMLDEEQETPALETTSEVPASDDEAESSTADSKGAGFKARAVAAEKAVAEGSRPPKKKKKPGTEAMFMGLGDIIFPGMLVISAMTYLAPIGGESAAFWVAIGVMLGGLCGYLFLMTRVALGIPQAGLPMLNGGSIIGFFIASLAFIGFKALEFNVTL